MAKANQSFLGHNTFGVPIQVAESVTGQWFYRAYQWNGYSRGWTKWCTLKEKPTFCTKGTNVYSGEEYEIEEGKLLNWGFKTLPKVSEKGIRLPN